MRRSWHPGEGQPVPLGWVVSEVDALGVAELAGPAADELKQLSLWATVDWLGHQLKPAAALIELLGEDGQMDRVAAQAIG